MVGKDFPDRPQGVSPIREPLREVPNGRNQGAKRRRGGSPGEHLQRGVRPFGASHRGSLIDDTP